MDIIDEVTEKGVTERRVDVTVDDEVVPGIVWFPDGSSGPRPTVLIGHGGTQHKRVPNVLSMARGLVRHLGYAAVAVDAPGHGDRVTDPAVAELARKNLEARLAGDTSGRLAQPDRSSEQMKAMVERSRQGSAEWSKVLDQISELPEIGSGPFGYWGVSMGTSVGLPFVAADKRIAAAVLGLNGLSGRPGQERFAEAAHSLTVPVLFMFQWDDELMTRQSGLDLFDAIGSAEKTMHINPGGHVGTPLHERTSYEDFYVRHLGPASTA
ncbi:MAG: alpha/beta hydrolase [Acidimicrobiia bacterium]|nr:alpha/beta hydrolase [Acidimicrobiia bacterium]